MSPISILFVPFHISDETSTESHYSTLKVYQETKTGAEIEVKKMIEIATEMSTDRDTEISVKYWVLVSL